MRGYVDTNYLGKRWGCVTPAFQRLRNNSGKRRERLADNKMTSLKTLTGVELSKRVAELYNIPAQNGNNLITTDIGAHSAFLHEDSTRCFKLMVDNSISVDWKAWLVYYSNAPGVRVVIEEKHDAALITAILQVLVKMAQERSDEHQCSSKKKGS